MPFPKNRDSFAKRENPASFLFMDFFHFMDYLFYGFELLLLSLVGTSIYPDQIAQISPLKNAAQKGRPTQRGPKGSQQHSIGIKNVKTESRIQPVGDIVE